MLGIFKLNRSWEWAGYGKHPVAKDYFSICENVPILKAFSVWVEKGHQSLKTDQHPVPWNSLRFWIRGPKKDLIMGILRDSSDSIGRIFPLLIIGTGSLKNWEKNWELLPYICEKTWARAEYLACKRYSDLSLLEADIKTIPTPQADWSEINTNKKNINNSPIATNIPNLQNKFEGLIQNGKMLFDVDANLYTDIQTLSTDMHILLKNKIGKTIPNAIFTTSVSGKVNTIVFQRPLATEDFTFLHNAAK